MGVRSDATGGGPEEAQATVFSSVVSIDAGQWVYVAATVDLATKSYKLYINGLEATATGTDHTTQASFVSAPNNVHIVSRAFSL